MKIIDLLNLMVIGEDLPKRIRYEDEEFFLTGNKETYIGCISHRAIGRRHCLEQCLTDEVEIIEENKKIEKIGYLNYCENPVESILHKKIDELIDEVNKLKGDKNEK